MDPVNLSDFESLARERMDPGAYGYYVGGAGDEQTLADNRAAFARIKLRPRMMVDVSSRDLGTRLLGQDLGMPVAIAPMAYQGLAHPEAERATAAAAAAAGIPFIMSTLANAPISDVAVAAPGRLWFQLYVFRDRGVSRALVHAAAAAGAKALVLTVDAPELGRRERDVRHGFSIPPSMRLGNLDEADHKLLRIGASGSAIEKHARTLFDASLTWKDVTWLARETSLPVLVKGILRGDDAERALAAGAAGIIVSNHGGRQLDGAVAGIDALPEVVRAASGRATVLVDGGVRRGVDVLRALALGADAVLVGRPVLWGLAAAGRDGVAAVLAMLREELSLAMALAGCARISDITPDLIARR